MKKLTNLDFAFGPAGWVKVYWRRGGKEQSVYVRVQRNERGGWDLTELHVDEPSAERLQEIPLHRIALGFNAVVDANPELLEGLEAGLSDELTADLDTTFREAFRREQPRRKKLKRPASRKLPDEFFFQVAVAYRSAAIGGLNPVMAIAEEAGVPHSTAARWVAQARERGFLPLTERGKVNALLSQAADQEAGVRG